MVQPKKPAAKKTASKKINKKSTNPADSYPNKKDKQGNVMIGGGEGTRPPFKSGGRLSKARNGKPVKKALLGSLLGGAAGGAGGSMLGGLGKQMLGGLASKALGGLMGGGAGGGATAQGGGAEQAPMQKRKSTDMTPVRTRGMMKKGGKVSKAKNGKSFPDLNKDGKITKADILKGRGVIAKKGATVKKAQDGNTVRGLRLMGENSRKVSPNKSKYVSEDGNYKMKLKGGSDTSAPTSAVQRRTLKGFLKGAPKAAGKMALKSGGSMKKCRYGCK